MKIYNGSCFSNIFVLSALVFLTGAWNQSVRADNDKNMIQRVSVNEQNDKTLITIQLSEQTDPRTIIQLEDPYRLVLELEGNNIYYDEKELAANKGIVSTIRFSLAKSALRIKLVDYIVIDTKTPFTYRIDTNEETWEIILKSKTPDFLETKPMKQIKDPLDIKQAILIAQSNHVPLQLAQEKINLARLRKYEALRALFPGLTAKYDHTRGTTRGEEGNLTLFGFTEQLMTLQLAQPLYQGGKLKATYDQSCINLLINELNYKKISLDLEFDVRKAFMNVAKNQQNIALVKKVQDDVKKDLDVSDVLFKQRASTRVEYLNVQSKYKQLLYQLRSVQTDLALSQAQLLQTLNLDAATLNDIVVETNYRELDVTVDILLQQMRLNKPDLKIAELELQLADLGKIIGHSSNNFKVDLTGALGRSKSYYDTETIDWKNDYSAGIKASKPFGGNTAGSSYVYDDTSPKLGQSSRSLSKTASAFVSILDNIKSLSDAAEADIAQREATQKLIDTNRMAAIEIKEHFYNYQKAVIQVQGLQEETRLNEEEVAIALQKKELNMAQISELVDSKIKLNSSLSSLNEAIAFYHISLAGMNRSIGLPDFYSPQEPAIKQ